MDIDLKSPKFMDPNTLGIKTVNGVLKVARKFPAL